jgi:hypothetical protein
MASQDPKYPTLYRVERDVVVDVLRASPGTGYRRQDELPLWVKTSALRLERSMRARQVDWTPRALDGGWLGRRAHASRQRQWPKSHVTMPLWLEPDMITTELTTGP